VNANLDDPEGEINLLDGDGDIKESPPPPLLNEKLDLDGDVYCVLCVVVGSIVEACGVDGGISVFVCIESSLFLVDVI